MTVLAWMFVMLTHLTMVVFVQLKSPEGQNIGLITSLAGYAKINEYGFIMTPYKKLLVCKVTDEVVYMTADEEKGLLYISSNHCYK